MIVIVAALLLFFICDPLVATVGLSDKDLKVLDVAATIKPLTKHAKLKSLIIGFNVAEVYYNEEDTDPETKKFKSCAIIENKDFNTVGATQVKPNDGTVKIFEKKLNITVQCLFKENLEQ